MLRFQKFLIIFFIFSFSDAWSCNGTSIEIKTSSKLYSSALNFFNKGYYLKALKIFDAIDSLYPFSEQAIKGSLLSAVASYKIYRYDHAILYSENYINLSTENQDFAYFIKIMSYYMKILDVALDQSSTEKALNLCEEFISIFPKSRYLTQIQIKYELIKNQLAAKEFLIANFYLNNGHYVPAISRLNIIFNRYRDTRYFKESAFKMLECYLALGQIEEAKKYLIYLKPNSSSDNTYLYKKALILIKNMKKS